MTNRITFDVKVTAVHCRWLPPPPPFSFPSARSAVGGCTVATSRCLLVFRAIARYLSVCGNIVAGIFIQSPETIPNCAHYVIFKLERFMLSDKRRWAKWQTTPKNFTINMLISYYICRSNLVNFGEEGKARAAQSANKQLIKDNAVVQMCVCVCVCGCCNTREIVKMLDHILYENMHTYVYK